MVMVRTAVRVFRPPWAPQTAQTISKKSKAFFDKLRYIIFTVLICRLPKFYRFDYKLQSDQIEQVWPHYLQGRLVYGTVELHHPQYQLHLIDDIRFK